MNIGGGIQRFMKLNLVGWSACGVKMQKHLNSHKNIAQVQIHMCRTGTCVSRMHKEPPKAKGKITEKLYSQPVHPVYDTVWEL